MNETSHLHISYILQNHLLSVFDNTRLVTFDEKIYDKILAINSQEGESISLDSAVMAQVGDGVNSNIVLHHQYLGKIRWTSATLAKIILTL